MNNIHSEPTDKDDDFFQAACIMLHYFMWCLSISAHSTCPF